MLIHTNEGASRIAPWPSQWDDDMELYLTVITRISNTLSHVLQKGEDDLDQPRLKQWNVNIQREVAIPPLLWPSDLGSEPLIEFLPMEQQVGRITLRLQSSLKISGSEDEEGISIIFEGIYDTKQHLRSSNFLW
jgi:hypothetical protein